MISTQNRLKNQPQKNQQPNGWVGSGILVGLCCSLLGTQASEAASFTFTKIADNKNSLFTGSNSWNGAINDQGTVAFYASSGIFESGIFTGDGNQVTTIANADILATVFPNPYPYPANYLIRSLVDINNQNTVAFSASASLLFGNVRRSGIFISNQGNIREVDGLISGRREGENLGGLDLNNQNALVTYVAYGGFQIDPTETITLYNNIGTDNQSSTIIAQGKWSNSQTGGITSLGSPSLNDQGNVLFSSVFRDISATDPQPPYLTPLIRQQENSQIVVTNNFERFRPSAINDQNKVAFLSTDNQGETGNFTFEKGNLTNIVNNQGLFSSFESIDINNQDTLAFSATLSTGKKGIFIGADPIADKVISVGDSLFGSTITKVDFFGDKGLNNNGQIAFFAALADGTEGIFRADPSSVPSKPVPEPTSIFSLLALGLGSWFVLRQSC